MTEQHRERAVVPRPRPLAPLSDELGEDERVFAEHLRELRARTGMTSADLAAALAADPTRLSRYLSGQSLPAPQLLTRLHRLVAGQDAGPDGGKEARESRALLYAAARAKGPLSARAYELAELQEKLHQQQIDTARSLAALQEDLQYEREHRHRAEQELGRLRQGGVEDQEAQVRQLEAERNAALRRVSELEDLVAQTGALLRLQQGDARHTQEMARATAGELQRWEDGATAAPAAPETEELQEPGKDWGMTVAEAVETLAELRDVDQDDEADSILLKAAQDAAPPTVVALYDALQDHGRRMDAQRLLEIVARRCEARRLRQLSVITRVMVLPAVPIPSPAVPGLPPAAASEGSEPVTEVEVSFADVLLWRVGLHTPLEQLVRLVRSLRERDELHFLASLASGASHRPRAERKALQSAGLGVPGPGAKLLNAVMVQVRG
ncbi:helix-turn-helix domain-containing protein [Streptomyces sp. NPDC053560]|uniref:helix-turn-helix domain-containing protein n=1 Tax=Streptomyces sp. NPDC053560 TaxID=3365711 RepID=UPI0037CE1514